MTGNNTSGFPGVIDLTAGSTADSFIGKAAPERGGATYGGQLLAQAATAAFRTVEAGRQMHSLHALFLRAGDVDAATTWTVERIRDGRSFSARSVSGRQANKEIFRVSLSFQVPEDGLVYQGEPIVDPASLPMPDEVEMSYVDFCRSHPDLDGKDWFGEDRPMEIRYIDPPDPAGGEPLDTPQLMWIKMAGDMSDDPADHQAGLAYLADSTLIDHVTLPHGRRWHDHRLTGVSLDHAMWFHHSARADDWLFYEQKIESTSGARGLASGRFFTVDGKLVASCTQEGLMRWSD